MAVNVGLETLKGTARTIVRILSVLTDDDMELVVERISVRF